MKPATKLVGFPACRYIHEMTTSKDIFLSYGREPEVVGFVTQLKHDLEQRGLSVWLDTEDIPAGSDWHAAIGTGLHNCRALIAIITAKYISSRYCTSELYTADGDQKLIFPVIFEDVDFSLSQKSKGVKYVISGINWTMFRPNVDNYQFSLSKLIEGMKESGLAVGSDSVDAGDLNTQMSGMHLSPKASATPTAPARPSSPYGFQPPHITPPHTSPYGYQHYPPSPHNYHTSPHNAYQQPSAYPPQNVSPMQAHGYHPPYGGNMYPAYSHNPQTFSSPPLMTTPPQETTPTQPPQYTELYPTATQQPSKPISKFRVGMKLEAVDRRFPYFVCVATIMDRNDDENEVLIHFDGWTDEYDYWCPCQSVELHPAGWCDKHSWELQAPHGQSWSSWQVYLNETQAEAALDDFFTKDQLAGPGSLIFAADMRVEAKDRKNPSMICAATITSVKKGKLLIHFDGFGHEYDYWCPASSTDVHPPMWSGKNGRRVNPPRGYSGFFKWSEYLTNPDINPAPAHLFTEEQLSADGRKRRSQQQGVESSLGGFKVGMKLEAKDRLNPTMIAVATVDAIKDGQLLIHFDGWTTKYDYWCKPDCGDIHPKGWCASNLIVLHPPRNTSNFAWNSYLQKCNAIAAPSSAFTKAQAA